MRGNAIMGCTQHTLAHGTRMDETEFECISLVDKINAE